jgi:uncharacterized damage-inducible protein DinB
MYRIIEDFIIDWQVEENFTISIFSKLNDEILSNKVSPKIRSLGRLAWHITQTLTEMPFKAGIIDTDYLENTKIPSNINEIIDTYQKNSINLIDNLRNSWIDSDLMKIIEVYGQQWEKRKILSALINHQIHHRAQMTILMRLQNIEVPGIYGPSREEWKKFGMNPHE